MSEPASIRSPRISVEADRIGALSEVPTRIFFRHTMEMERAYAMFSVALDDAIRLRDAGSGTTAIQEAMLASDLCHRLSDRLRDMPSLLIKHCKKYGISPSVTQLGPTTFHSWGGTSGARSSFLLKFVPYSQQGRFLSKISDLEQIVEKVSNDFRAAAEELACSAVRASGAASLWEIMDASHFGLNTCLREVVVMLKCFLRALPLEQCEIFDSKAIERKTLTRSAQVPARTNWPSPNDRSPQAGGF
jgi:hypothetical protein